MKNLYLFAVNQGSGNISILGTFDESVLAELEIQWKKRTLDFEAYAGGDGINWKIINVSDTTTLESLGLEELTLSAAREAAIG